MASCLCTTKLIARYAGIDPDDAVRDFRARIAHYERAYEPIESDTTYIKVMDVGRRLVVDWPATWVPRSAVDSLTGTDRCRRVFT